jgi:hypothetical protein
VRNRFHQLQSESGSDVDGFELLRLRSGGAGAGATSLGAPSDPAKESKADESGDDVDDGELMRLRGGFLGLIAAVAAVAVGVISASKDRGKESKVDRKLEKDWNRFLVLRSQGYKVIC